MTLPGPDFETEASRAGHYPGRRFNQRERKILESVKAYVDSVAPAGPASITNEQLAGPWGTATPGLFGLSQVATAIYDFAEDGGAVSTIPLGVLMPVDSLVWAVTSQVITAPDSAGSAGTIKLVFPVDGDLTPTEFADGTATSINTVATQVPRLTTALRQLSVTIGIEALTAGKIRYFVHYVQASQASAIPGLVASLMGASYAFEVLAGSTVTNTGATAVIGDLGVSPGSAITGFPPGTVSGTQHANDAAAIQAQVDLTSAYTTLAALTPTAGPFGVSDIGGTTKGPGVYNYSSSLAITGVLTLDAGGNSGAQFVFQVGSTLTTAAASQVVLINGALSTNVCWQVGSSATFGTTTDFKGSVFAQASITATTGATFEGKLLARTGAVTLDTNQADT